METDPAEYRRMVQTPAFQTLVKEYEHRVDALRRSVFTPDTGPEEAEILRHRVIALEAARPEKVVSDLEKRASKTLREIQRRSAH
jgi:hypothetical protein